LTWDTTLTEFAQFVNSKCPEEEYHIRPYDDTECIVGYNGSQGSVSYEAIFPVAGGVDRNVIEYRPEALAGKKLQLESVGKILVLSKRPLSNNAEIIDAFHQTYQEYAPDFGGGDTGLSYVSTKLSTDDVNCYAVPEINGEVDPDRIESYCNDQIDSFLSYEIFLRDEHAQYRLSVFHLEDSYTDDKPL
jgi:hypothetical protein